MLKLDLVNIEFATLSQVWARDFLKGDLDFISGLRAWKAP